MSPDFTPLHDDLNFNSPLSDSHADRLIASLGELGSGRVVDFGCGWAELLLRVLESAGSATGLGIDQDVAAIEHGRALAVGRGLADRVELIAANAADWRGAELDAALCVGSSHVWGGTGEALRALRGMLRRGGRVLLGEGIWLQPPTAAATAALGGAEDEFGTLADLVDLAVAESFRPLAISQASPAEWDDFESGYALGYERWLQEHPVEDDERADVLAQADEHRRRWLRGYRGVLGFGYLTLTAQ